MVKNYIKKPFPFLKERLISRKHPVNLPLKAGNNVFFIIE